MKHLLNIAVLGFAMLLIGCGREEMPPIEDGNKLQKDCIRLMELFPEGPLDPKMWPPSVRDMKPIQVTREKDCVRILVRQERGKYTVGYDVFADARLAPSTKGVWVQKTKFKGVYIFQMPY